MSKLGCSKREALMMTPREYMALMNCYLEEKGIKKQDQICGIDDLP